MAEVGSMVKVSGSRSQRRSARRGPQHANENPEHQPTIMKEKDFPRHQDGKAVAAVDRRLHDES